MKISLEDLTKPREFTVTGDEAWLSAIYESFPTPMGFEAPRLAGRVTVTPDNYGSFRVAGSLAYEPYVDCSRCDAKIAWPIRQEFDVVFRQAEAEGESPKKERDLQREELDFYFYEDDAIDLEELLNEQVQTAVPLRTVRKDEHDQCLVCQRDLRGDLAYGSSAPARPNPFAALKDLKLDDE